MDLAFFSREFQYMCQIYFSKKPKYWSFISISWNKKAKSGINEVKSAEFVYKQKQSKAWNGRTLKNSVKIFQWDFYEFMAKSSKIKTEGSIEPLSS